MKATVLVPCWNGATYIVNCLAAVQAQVGGAPNIVVVDNGSTDGSVARVREQFPAAHMIENGHNLGFAGGVNVGLRWLQQQDAPPDAVVLLNQDTVVATDWLANLLAPLADDERIGAVGCKIFYPNGATLQHAGGYVDPVRGLSHHHGHHERDTGQYDQPGEVEYVTGAAMALRMSALAEIGLFDEGYNPAYYEEIDLCWRLRRARYRIYYTPAATLRHAESRSFTDEVARSALAHRNRLRFVVKTFSAEQLAAFRAAECAHVATLPHSTELRVLRRAYLEGILRRDEWIAARRHFHAVAPEQERHLRELCGILRGVVAQADRTRPW